MLKNNESAASDAKSMQAFADHLSLLNQVSALEVIDGVVQSLYSAEDEAWNLFRDKAYGELPPRTTIKPIAEYLDRKEAGGVVIRIAEGWL